MLFESVGKWFWAKGLKTHIPFSSQIQIYSHYLLNSAGIYHFQLPMGCIHKPATTARKLTKRLQVPTNCFVPILTLFYYTYLMGNLLF